MPRKSLEDRILEAYTTPGHPIAYSAPGRVARFFDITKSRAEGILQGNEAYTLHKEYHRPSQYNPVYCYRGIREIIQTDVIDIRSLSQHNDGVNYLALFIDCFSRRIWVYPMRRKTGVEMADVITRWLESLGLRRRVKVINSDSGTEYLNRSVAKVLKDWGIEHKIAVGTSKCSLAERCNRTLQILIYKYLSDNETFRYLDALDDLVRSYNQRAHRSLNNMTPLEADRIANELRVRAIHLHRYAKIKRKKPKYAVGDTVRVKTDPHGVSSGRRAYAEQFKGEFFTIERVNSALPRPMYYLRSLNTHDQIKGGFYGNELSKLQGEIYRVEKILRTRKRRGKTEYLVRWKYFNDTHDSWEPAENITRVF